MRKDEHLFNKLSKYPLPPKKVLVAILLQPRNKMASFAEALAACFIQAKTPLRMAELLLSKKEEMEKMIREPLYKHFRIPKKSGGFREISAPEKPLKLVQYLLNIYLQHYYSLIRPKSVHGFTISPIHEDEHRNIVTNAAKHVGKQWVLNIDLKDFFPGISARRVYDLFRGPYFQFDHEKAAVLALLSTYKKCLPAGAPSSPVISNFICLELDRDLEKFSKINSLAYTRYADDLTFSSAGDIPENMVLDIMGIILKNGFNVNDKKVRKQGSSQQQIVTGLVVNERVNVVRKKLKIVRAMLHDCRFYGTEIAAMRHYDLNSLPDRYHEIKFLRKLYGLIGHIGQVRGATDPLYLKMREEFISAGYYKLI